MPNASSGLQIIKRIIVKPLFFLSLFAVFLICDCSKTSQKSQLSEGEIEYDITYVNNSGRNFPIQLLPKTMQLTFNQNFAAYTIKDRVGLFAIKIISDLKKHNHITLIKVFDKKYVYQSEGKETPVFFKPDISYKIISKSDTTRINGLLCYNIIVEEPENKTKIPVTYIPINFKNPNYNTPYSDVKGLLMNFNLQMKSLDMKLTAKKVDEKIIKDEEFEIPGGYKAIPRIRMEEIITTLLP